MTKAVLINDTRADCHYGCDRVIGTIERQAAANGMTIIARSPVHSDWCNDPEVLDAIARADIVIVNGEGTVHSNRPPARSLVSVADHCRTVGKPAVLINSCWFNNGPELAEMARGFAMITVRESESERQLKSAGLDCRRIADLALNPTIEVSAPRSGIGVTDSVLADVALDLDRMRRRVGGVPVTLFHGMTGISGLRFFLRQYGVRRLLNRPAALAGALRATATSLAGQASAVDVLTDLIGRLELLVTGRFHAAIFALAARTPLLAVESNTPKISATLKDAGLEPWRVRPTVDFDDRIMRRATAWTGEEEANLRDFLSDNRKRQSDLFKDMVALAA